MRTGHINSLSNCLKLGIKYWVKSELFNFQHFYSLRILKFKPTGLAHFTNVGIRVGNNIYYYFELSIKYNIMYLKRRKKFLKHKT